MNITYTMQYNWQSALCLCLRFFTTASLRQLIPTPWSAMTSNFMFFRNPCNIFSSFVYMNRNICWSELWLGKVFQNNRVVHLIEVARRFEQSCKMWCAVCTLPDSHKSEPHRPINFMLAANRPTPVLRRLSWTQAVLRRSQPGGCGPNAEMKDWRAAGIGVVGSSLIDNNSTEEVSLMLWYYAIKINVARIAIVTSVLKMTSCWQWMYNLVRES